jgi:hypothetical protein
VDVSPLCEDLNLGVFCAFDSLALKVVAYFSAVKFFDKRLSESCGDRWTSTHAMIHTDTGDGPKTGEDKASGSKGDSNP